MTVTEVPDSARRIANALCSTESLLRPRIHCRIRCAVSMYPILATMSWYERSMTVLPGGEGIVYAAIFNKQGLYARAAGGDTLSQIIEINQTCGTSTSSERLFAKGPGCGDSVLNRFWSHTVTHATYFEIFRGAEVDVKRVEESAQHAFAIAAGGLPLANKIRGGGRYPKVEIRGLYTLFTKHASVVEWLKFHSNDVVCERMEELKNIVLGWCSGGGRTLANVGGGAGARKDPISWTLYIPPRPTDGVLVYRGLRTDPTVKKHVAAGRCNRQDRFLVQGVGNNYVSRRKTPPTNLGWELNCLARLTRLGCR